MNVNQTIEANGQRGTIWTRVVKFGPGLTDYRWVWGASLNGQPLISVPSSLVDGNASQAQGIVGLYLRRVLGI